MKKYIILSIFIVLINTVLAQDFFKTDTFTNTVNLDLSKNLYMKSVPIDLLRGFCKGTWNAYYPKREMSQCLFDDFLGRFGYYQLNIPDNATLCLNDYCNHAYYTDMFQQCTRKLKYKEIVYFDQQHSIVKREVLWIQVFYSRQTNDTWTHYEGPVFWLQEIRKLPAALMIENKSVHPDAWTLDKEFNHPCFIVNDNKQPDDKKKIQKIIQPEEY